MEPAIALDDVKGAPILLFLVASLCIDPESGHDQLCQAKPNLLRTPGRQGPLRGKTAMAAECLGSRTPSGYSTAPTTYGAPPSGDDLVDVKILQGPSFERPEALDASVLLWGSAL